MTPLIKISLFPSLETLLRMTFSDTFFPASTSKIALRMWLAYVCCIYNARLFTRNVTNSKKSSLIVLNSLKFSPLSDDEVSVSLAVRNWLLCITNVWVTWQAKRSVHASSQSFARAFINCWNCLLFAKWSRFSTIWLTVWFWDAENASCESWLKTLLRKSSETKNKYASYDINIKGKSHAHFYVAGVNTELMFDCLWY